MITLEQVEKIREVTGVSYNQAKAVLETTKGDLLEAVLLLEAQGMINKPVNDGFVSTASTQPKQPAKPIKQEDDSFKKFIDWLKQILHLGNVNYFVVYKQEREIISIPMTIFVLLLLFAFWVIFPLMIVGLFFNYRYRFAGPNFTNEKVNKTVDTISNATIKTGEVVKEAVTNLSKELKKEDTHDKDSSN